MQRTCPLTDTATKSLVPICHDPAAAPQGMTELKDGSTAYVRLTFIMKEHLLHSALTLAERLGMQATQGMCIQPETSIPAR